MKNIFTSLLLVCLLPWNGLTQCTQSAFGFGNNSSIPSYNISGDVTVVLNTNNTITLNLGTNFMTAAGPDVRAYLVNPGNLTNNQLKSTPIENLPNIIFGLVSSTTINPNGAKTFTVDVPTGINISNYTKVFFYCLAFNAFWDFGSINGFTASNCALLSIENSEQITFSMYPNPANNKVHIDGLNEGEQYSYSIISMQGVIVKEEKEIVSAIDISSLSNGLYIIEIKNSQQQKNHKKFLKI